MVTDQEISQALQTLIQESSNNSGINSLNDLVQELEKKLGQDLSHKADFIRNQIHFIFRAHPTAPQQHQQPQPQHQSQSQPHPPPPQLNDRFAPHQNPNFHPTPSAFQTFLSILSHRRLTTRSPPKMSPFLLPTALKRVLKLNLRGKVAQGD
uniref:DEK-C domain-containing protein n=1 Tax=Cannabis sativa TaxID=3483 RepID=A0A803R9R9_CANSA